MISLRVAFFRYWHITPLFSEFWRWANSKDPLKASEPQSDFLTPDRAEFLTTVSSAWMNWSCDGWLFPCWTFVL
jgi:hypothetical protein